MRNYGDCPESLRRTAIGWAMCPPDGRSEQRHDWVVYSNFSDVFRDLDEFMQKVKRRRFFRRHPMTVQCDIEED